MIEKKCLLKCDDNLFHIKKVCVKVSNLFFKCECEVIKP
jgi:hypothetical protein